MSTDQISLYLMALLYIAAGVNHFVMPRFYLSIIPPFLPWPQWINRITGFAEIALGMGLMVPQLTALAAWGIILLLIAVFPANIYHFMKGVRKRKLIWILALRLPVQFLLIWWAYSFT